MNNTKNKIMEKKNTYTVDYFIKKFSAIPEESWFVGDYLDMSATKFCALGHCGVTNSSWRNNKEDEAENLRRLFLNTLRTNATLVNDGGDQRYPQPTPKQRMLAALHDIKKLQENSTPSEPKEEPAYKPIVTCSEKVKQLAKEEIIYS